MNNYLMINAVLFIFVFLVDLFSLMPGKFNAASAVLILSYNGGYFLSSAYNGNFPGDEKHKFSKMNRIFYYILGIILFVTGFFGAVAILI